MRYNHSKIANIYPFGEKTKKKRNVLKRIFELMNFFCAMFSFWDMVDFVFYLCNSFTHAHPSPGAPPLGVCMSLVGKVLFG